MRHAQEIWQGSKRLIRKDATLLEARSENVIEPEFFLAAATPLIVASYLGHEEIVEWLLDQGADIRARDGLGDHALHHASTKVILVLSLY